MTDPNDPGVKPRKHCGCDDMYSDKDSSVTKNNLVTTAKAGQPLTRNAEEFKNYVIKKFFDNAGWELKLNGKS